MDEPHTLFISEKGPIQSQNQSRVFGPERKSKRAITSQQISLVINLAHQTHTSEMDRGFQMKQGGSLM